MRRWDSAPLTLFVSGLGFAEGPRWHEGKLWFSDFGTRLVQTVDASGQVMEVARVAARPSGLGFLPDGRLLIVSMNDQRLLRLEHGVLHEHADLSRFTAHACNDMVVDREGNAFIGHMGFDLLARGAAPKLAEIFCVRANGESHIAASDLSFPNGPAISEDGRTLIVAETFAGRLSAFTIGEGGALSARRVFAPLPGRAPDGICLDAEGAVWVADARGKACIRVREGGEITDVIPTGRGCYACALGGSDGRTLFLCTAEGYDLEAMALGTGAIEIARVTVPAARRFRADLFRTLRCPPARTGLSDIAPGRRGMDRRSKPRYPRCRPGSSRRSTTPDTGSLRNSSRTAGTPCRSRTLAWAAVRRPGGPAGSRSACRRDSARASRR